MFTRNLFALALMAGAMTISTAYAKSFPAWDINKYALYEVQHMNELYRLDAEENINMKGVEEWNSYPQERVFNAYVAWETHCRDYVSTHWNNY